MRCILLRMVVIALTLSACGGTDEGVSSLPADATNDVDGHTGDGSTGGDDGADGQPSGDAATGAHPGSAPHFAYVAQRGVSTPIFVPINGAGVSPDVALGPRRGAGYGMGPRARAPEAL